MAAPEGTIVTLTRAPRGSNPEWDAYYDDITEGWRIFLEQLRFAVERHGLSERRTIIFDGALADGRSPADALGLAEAAALPPGAPYRAPATTGEELSGTVWARSPGRLVLTVEGVGDGLLVLAEQPSAPHRPAGGVLVLLTTYGLDDAAFGRVEARWTSWWEAHRAPAPAGTPGDGPEDQRAEQHASQPVGQNTE
ncbi:hypothetical protein [Actinomadura sp. HBU206391]|uniref:hypothetical protein n=1 Tax=Actinomadura sp. HBU206391 TaxID=2731692 RepID=UPI001650D0B2|nr:hypothetical protein [Actinomadura sp. HBU206391]MBC6459442.1 hypothetical protein [Actinomadura sp. HBU206391]